MKKPRKIVWHKRKGKFISSDFLKPHAALEKKSEEADASVCEEKDHRKLFFKNLARQIKSAAGEKP
jgi:hypothetical protein